MGLVACAECGARVSAAAPNCVKCGAPLSLTIARQARAKADSRDRWRAILIVGAIVFVGVPILISVSGYVDGIQKKKEAAQ